jgi:dihydroxy-acid dehydratase
LPPSRHRAHGADWEKHGYDLPLIVNLQPAGEYLGEDYHRAGGVPAVVAELIGAGQDPRGLHHGERQDHRRELQGQFSWDRSVIREFEADEGASGLQAPAPATSSTMRS